MQVGPGDGPAGRRTLAHRSRVPFIWPPLDAWSETAAKGVSRMKDERIDAMPLSVRLGEEGEAVLERWVDEGRFDSKSAAIRAALNTFERIQEAKREGRSILSLSEEDLERLREEANLVVGTEIV